jgi:Flp pilus assembly pilin Flp
MSALIQLHERLQSSEDGATAVEYGLHGALVAAVVTG